MNNLRSILDKGLMGTVIALGLLIVFILVPSVVLAGVMELGVNGSYMSYQNTKDSRTITRSVGGSFSYRFLAFSSIELAYAQDQTKETGNNGVFSWTLTTIGDRYTASWIQNLTSRESVFQPYAKLGIGYIDRLQRVEVSAENVELVEDSRGHSVTGITGLGFRVFIAKQFALRAEGTVFWSGMDGSPTRHYMYSGGISWFF